MLYNLTIITVFLALFLGFGLGVFTILKNPKSKAALLWFLTMMAFSTWAVGAIFTYYSTDNPSVGNYFNVIYTGATFVPMFFFHFVVVFLYKDRNLKLLIVLGYLAAIVMVYLAVATNYIIAGLQYHEVFGWHEEVAGVGFYFYLAYFLTLVVLGLGLLIQGLLNSDGVRRRKILFILIASTIAFIGGTSNFFTDLTGIYPYAQMIIWVFPLLITYGVFMEPLKVRFSR